VQINKSRTHWERAAFCFGTTGLNLTEPLHGFRPGFSLAEGLVIVTSRRQLVQAIGAAPLSDTDAKKRWQLSKLGG
jgi:hypothetical protein